MTNAELDIKIAETMSSLRADNVVGSIAKAWNDYSDVVKEEARKHKKKGEKLADAIERITELEPCDIYCYIMFGDNGDLEGWTIDGSQYWQGHSGPSSAISISPGTTYEDIEQEIGNDLAEALDIED
jgi:hypothetical protein